MMQGSRGGYSGIHLGPNTGYMTVMDNQEDKGIYEQDWNWILYFNRRNKKLGLRTSNNTGYAVTCEGDFYCKNGWLRTDGNRGWYNESYGGGWYMSDSTWIRSYGSKSVYVNTGELRCDGSTWGGMNRLTSNWHGFYSGNGGGTRYGYIQCDANRMYFRKENGVSTYHFDFGGHIYTSSNMYGVNFYTTSDRHKKKHIQSIDRRSLSDLFDVSDKLLKQFEWKQSGKISYGFIAQQLEKYVPEAVSQDNEGIKSVSYDIAYAKIIAALVHKVKALEELVSSRAS